MPTACASARSILIVRDLDDKDKIIGLGLSFEPTAPVARVPIFMSAGEIVDRVRALIRNWRKPAETRSPQAEPEKPRRSRRWKRQRPRADATRRTRHSVAAAYFRLRRR